MPQPRAGGLHRDLLFKLVVVTAVMFGFGYAMVPLYRAICESLGINVLSLAEKQVPGMSSKAVPNTQVDTSRLVTIEFDANARGPWAFKPEKRYVEVHPGQLASVVYEFTNPQQRAMSAQAIPSYAPKQATAHFNKLECFCFQQHALQPGESKRWPVTFVVDPKLPKDVKTITLSYTFFEVGSGVPAAPSGQLGANATGAVQGVRTDVAGGGA
ncbi:cytochrome c oxidase assembly protein [Aquabacterium lacunae]|uniref:Cytochrome c oxidase assembly protein CtaG n=1 Tax=Aquabacterium lacunae TaxID=2528630 RepID=A0A4V2JG09_9BURK|nr:cytochrome c oxidase assembly protein [Aquabacterium lacunae]TBO32966.1 cytochrome c oxidase assembly protein [Aquabacterium lacunae]